MNVPAALSCGALLRRRSSFESFVANPQKLKTSVFQTSHFFLRTVSRAESKTSYLCGNLLPRNNPNFFLFASGVDLVVGRLGFEPRQRDSKSLDLPLVDRPISSFAIHSGLVILREAEDLLLQFLCHYNKLRLPCEHSRPVLRPGQGLRQESLNPKLQTGSPDTPLSSLSIRSGPIQSKQRRT